MNTIHQLSSDDALSLADRAYAELEEQIVTMALAPGQSISEHALAESLGIGRTPVREALQRLSREGMVRILPRRGIEVAELDVPRQLKLLELRREIERFMARKAAERASTSQRDAFTQLANDMQAAVDSEDDLSFLRLDAQFNRMVNEAAGNEFATGSIELMAGLSRRFWFVYSRRAPGITTMARRHIAVARAIAGADTDQAAVASDRLLDFVESITRNAIDW